MVSMRKTRSARRTARGPVAGTSAMATTEKSNTLQGSRQNARRCTNKRKDSSATKTAKMIWSMSKIQRPADCMTEVEVSKPRITALMTISARMVRWKIGVSSQAWAA